MESFLPMHRNSLMMESGNCLCNSQCQRKKSTAIQAFVLFLGFTIVTLEIFVCVALWSSGGTSDWSPGEGTEQIDFGPKINCSFSTRVSQYLRVSVCLDVKEIG